MTVTIDVSNVKIILYPSWLQAVLIRPGNTPVQLSFSELEVALALAKAAVGSGIPAPA